MAYSTLADLLKYRDNKTLCELTDVEVTRDTVDPTPDTLILGQADAAVDAEIEGYLAKRYPVPLSSVPQLIRHIAVILKLEWLYGKKNERPKTVTDDAATVRKILEQLRDGGMALDELQETASEYDNLEADEPCPVFSGRHFNRRYR